MTVDPRTITVNRTQPAACLALLVFALVGCGPSSSPTAEPDGADRPGLAASALLGADSTRLRVRVDHVAGHAPSPRALDLLERRLQDHCGQPEGVVVERGVLLPSTASAARFGQPALRALADAAPVVAAPGEAVIQILYLGGRSEDDDASQVLLGLSFGARRLAVFHAAILETCPTLCAPEDLEAAVILHEVGHLLGLVGLGAPVTARHDDLFRPGHCANRCCVMAARSTDWGLAGLFSVGAEPDFCPDCQADLRAAGGR